MSPVVKVVKTKSPRSPKGPPSNHAKNPPELTQCLTIGDNKRVKLSSIIFKAGENLLREKITNLASGLPEEKYSISQHLHKLNNMFPETKEYESEHLKDAIKSYNTYARKKVADSEETGQGKMDSETYSMNCSDELKYVCLLSDARKSCKEYQGISGAVDKSSLEDLEEEGNINDVGMDILEEVECCFLCESPEDLVRTDDGKACRRCLLHNSPTENETVKNIRHASLQGKEQAIIQQHSELMEMEETTHSKRKTKKTKVKGWTRTYGTGESDDEIGKALLAHLKSSQVRESLEFEKLKWDILIRKRKLNMKI